MGNMLLFFVFDFTFPNFVRSPMRQNGDFMKKIISILLSLTLMIPTLSACFGGGDEISVLYYTYSDTYISDVRAATDAALGEVGLNFHNYDATSMQTTQTEQADTAITKGTTLLAVNIVDTGSSDAARAIVEKARGANIPLIFFNRSVEDAVIESYDKCVFIGTDYEAAGVMQGEMIGKYLIEHYDEVDLNGDGVISYVMFKGQQGNAEAEARTKAYYQKRPCADLVELSAMALAEMLIEQGKM